eukprot:PhM_4_TR9473/c4_g2_i8/m.2170
MRRKRRSNSNNKNSDDLANEAITQQTQRRLTEYHFGYHPTASRAVMLMGIAASATKQSMAPYSFILPMHPAVDVLSYCVDTELVYSVGFGDSGDSFCDTSTPVVLMSVCGGLRRELALAPV